MNVLGVCGEQKGWIPKTFTEPYREQLKKKGKIISSESVEDLSKLPPESNSLDESLKISPIKENFNDEVSNVSHKLNNTYLLVASQLET